MIRRINGCDDLPVAAEIDMFGGICRGLNSVELDHNSEINAGFGR